MITHSLPLNKSRILQQYHGRASNQYILENHTRESTFLVDCGMPSDAPGFKHALKGMPPLKRVVCTHFHVDHVSGWVQVKRFFPSADIWFHKMAEPLVKGLEVFPQSGFRALFVL